MYVVSSKVFIVKFYLTYKPKQNINFPSFAKVTRPIDNHITTTNLNMMHLTNILSSIFYGSSMYFSQTEILKLLAHDLLNYDGTGMFNLRGQTFLLSNALPNTHAV